MDYIKIKSALYPASFAYRQTDAQWDGRESRAITLEMAHSAAVEIFVDNAAWSMVSVENTAAGEATQELDCSAFCVAGDITDHRNGTITVKMGRETPLETALKLLLLGGDGDV